MKFVEAQDLVHRLNKTGEVHAFVFADQYGQYDVIITPPGTETKDIFRVVQEHCRTGVPMSKLWDKQGHGSV